MNHNLNKEEKAYLYELLYKFEYGSRAGYQDDKLDTMIADVAINDNYKKKDNIAAAPDNSLHFTPYYNNKCWAILYHVRNAFAHGNIESVDNDKMFLIKDYSDRKNRQVCNMYAKIEKEKFYRLINAIEKSKEISSKKRQKNNSKMKKS